MATNSSASRRPSRCSTSLSAPTPRWCARWCPRSSRLPCSTEILRRLAAEGISLRSLREILGALAERAPVDSDPVTLTEHVRAALRRQITFAHAGGSGVLGVYFLDPMIEDTVREAIQRTASGSTLALEPELASDIVKAVGRAVADTAAPVIVTTARHPLPRAPSDRKRASQGRRALVSGD